MNQETFFTLTEYKENYERLKKEFVNAYVDNDKEEFIFLQVEWYQKCIENTIIEHGIIADSVGYETKANIRGKGFVGVVDKKIRNERGFNYEAIQNLNVSFKKIIIYLERQREDLRINENKKMTPTQWALYFYILQKCEIKPRFIEKLKEIEDLSEKRNINAKNFQLRYNEISKFKGLEGYLEKDAIVVNRLLKEHHPATIPVFEELTKNIF